MSSQKFLRFLIAELILTGLVVLAFRSIENRLQAGVVAGSLFVGLGLWILISGLRDIVVRRSLTFYWGLAHLFLSSFPLLITRLLNQASAFERVQVLGLSGPVFHRLSTFIYIALLISTVIDWLWAKRRESKLQL